MIKGLPEAAARRIVRRLRAGPVRDVETLAAEAALDQGELAALAAADALAGLAGHRYRARWAVAGVEPPLPLLADAAPAEGLPLLRRPTEGREIVADYRSLGLTLRRHPLSLLRARLARERLITAAELGRVPHGFRVRHAGIVINRQRPGSAGGVTFVTLEDETGHVNLIVWRTVAARQRRALLGSRLLEVVGQVQREGEVLHLIAERLRDRSELLGELLVRSRDFH
jgi:error-prone DNA polymerase